MRVNALQLLRCRLLTHVCTSCRLVYDDHNHFQSFDVDEGDAAPGGGDMDFYDYDDSAPAGCQRGMEAHFMLNAIPANTAWADTAVNKAAFWTGQTAAAGYTAGSSDTNRAAPAAVGVQSYVCRAVPARVSQGTGGIYTIFPLASIVLSAVIVLTALLALLMWCCSACFRRHGTPPLKN